MNTIKVHDKTFVRFIKHEDILAAIGRVCTKLNEDYAGGKDIPVLLCTLHGAIPFTAEVMKRLDFDVMIGCIKISSYNGMKPGEVKMTTEPTVDVKGKRILVMEDIVDTGATLVAIREILKNLGASDVRVCSLLYKPDSFSRQMKQLGLEASEHEPEYCGIPIENDFVVGFGMDYDQLGRNYSDIYRLQP